MELDLIKKQETPLLGRKRFEYKARFEGKTPSRDSLKKSIASQNKLDEANVIIKHIYTKFGSNEAKVIAHAYNDLETAKKIEEAHLIKKHFPEPKKE